MPPTPMPESISYDPSREPAGRVIRAFSPWQVLIAGGWAPLRKPTQETCRYSLSPLWPPLVASMLHLNARARIDVIGTWIERRDSLCATRIVAGRTMPPTFLRTPRPPYTLLLAGHAPGSRWNPCRARYDRIGRTSRPVRSRRGSRPSARRGSLRRSATRSRTNLGWTSGPHSPCALRHPIV